MRQSTKTAFIATRGFRAFLPCRAAVVLQDPGLLGGDRPPPPGLGRVGVAEAEPRADGTLIPVDRVAAGRPFYSGKHRRHGMSLQVIASPAGPSR